MSSRRLLPLEFLIFISLFLSFDSAAATNHKYVYSGATGNGSGSDWVNAFRDTPSGFERDTVYYFAGGNYSGTIISTPVDGTRPIILQKATPSDHGTDTGWLNSMASTAAKFNSPLQFFTSNITVDGVTGSGTVGFGFEIYFTNAGYHLVSVPGDYPDQTNITVKHCEMHFDTRHAANTANAFYFAGATSNLYIGYNYIHDIPGCAVLTRSCNNVVFEYNHIARNRSNAQWHAEGWSDSGSSNVVCRYNIWEDIEGTGVIVNLNAGTVSTADNWQIYGNVFYLPQNHVSTGYGHGIATCINAQECTNWKFYNNTISNIVEGLAAGLSFEVSATGNEVIDNLWYCAPGRTCKPANHYNVNSADYNYYFSSIDHYAETRQQIGTTDPFFNSTAGNFQLTADTAGGLPLSAPYNQDMYGVIRGFNGTWDRGAYQFSNGQALSPPKNLRIVQ